MGADPCFCIWTGTSTQALKGVCEFTSSRQQQLRKFSFLSYTYTQIPRAYLKKIKKMYVVALLLSYLGIIFSYIFFLLNMESWLHDWSI